MTKVYTYRIPAPPEAVAAALERHLPALGGASAADPPQIALSNSSPAIVTVGTDWRYQRAFDSQMRHARFFVDQERMYTTLNCVAGKWSERGEIKHKLGDLAAAITQEIGVVEDQLPVRWVGSSEGVRDDGFLEAMTADLASGALPCRAKTQVVDHRTEVTLLRSDGTKAGQISAQPGTFMSQYAVVDQVDLKVEIGPGVSAEDAVKVAQAMTFWVWGRQIGTEPPQSGGLN